MSDTVVGKIEQLTTRPAVGASELKAMLDAIRGSLMKDPLFRQFTEQGFWHAHHVDVVWRFNGEDKRFEADWLKDIWYVLKAPNTPLSGERSESGSSG